MLPDSQSALVAERTTGAVKEVSVRAEPKVKMVMPVDRQRRRRTDGHRVVADVRPGPADVRLRQHADRQPGHPHRRRRRPQADSDRHPQGRHRQHGRADLHQPDHAAWCRPATRATPRRRAIPGSLAGKVLRIEQPTTVDQAPTTTALSGLGAGGGHVHRPVRRVALRHRSHADRATGCSASPRIPRCRRCGRGPTAPVSAGCAALDGTVLVNLVNTKQTVAVRLAPGHRRRHR